METVDTRKPSDRLPPPLTPRQPGVAVRFGSGMN